jgi:diadenosine tetraphosphatase ApaH/serine/threonine PP2A family protein phosphatase
LRIGIFSDVHSNLEALQSVIAFFSEKKIRQYLIIGDFVGYGANPNECINRIKKLDCFCVAGNHDYAVLDKTDIRNFNDAAKAAIIWTKTELTKESKEFLSILPLQKSVNQKLLVHSTPENPADWEYIFTLKQGQNEFKFFKEQICFIGHSHCPFIIEKDQQKNEYKIINEQKFKIKEKSRYIINVGSVGQPRDGDARACLTLFDTLTKHIEFKRVEYDIKSAQHKIIQAGLPTILAKRLAEGK